MPNATSPFNGFEFLSRSRTNITSGVYSVLAITTALNIFTFPFAILLNTLVIVAVKTKRHLRTKSNISLACLATTDFAGRRELRVEGEWGTPEETGTRVGTELQCIVVAVGLEDGGDVFLKRINS
ncbi:hypothetical protein pdam_00020138 [Pocillopora damicornis]|uniref:Uncharacterized protein n=1 Tax=Pocillopora damicornis TaxID=46731 RepID=A0A3M6UBS5_POCDA|nr:hypothetical protein pdam_00020138 [Pocillopora damicornis]